MNVGPPVGDWALDPDLAFLNHGSFGACPRDVLEEQRRLRDRMESDPVRFLALDLPDLLSAARVAAADFIGADPDGFAFVPNATTGINTVLASLAFEPGDEILFTDHGYEACNLAAENVAERHDASVRIARIPIPVEDPAEIRAAVLEGVGPRTRIAVIDHITSPTALVFPIAGVVADLAERGVMTIIDGAHAPGSVDLDVGAIGAAAYVGNWHKWTCAPKGAGFVWLNVEWREEVRPLVVSHGAGLRGADVDRFRATFDWTGTFDPTPYLCVPKAIRTVGGMLDGGWPEIRERNHRLVMSMRDRIVEKFGLVPTGSDAVTGVMASFRLPSQWRSVRDLQSAARELVRRLDDEHRVVVAVATRRNTDDIYLRISAHLHSGVDAVERLITALDTF